ncbi:hypothetical protein [Nocardia arizonensis]|uniref:hypothetical protein n=1 Tax=Nocardia arizonensis TaxID=1141647 RepID=UPI0006CFF653|nr:hypothetical protein [Nocardia arizonensis]
MKLRMPGGSGGDRALRERVQHARLIPAEQAVAVPRPDIVDSFYLEQEFNARAEHQVHLHDAEGERAAAKPAALAAGLEPGNVETAYLIDANRPMVNEAQATYAKVKAALHPLAVRKGSSLGYRLRTAGLLVGDIAGLGGAGIAYGELPALALAQAASAGVATITAGLVGTQVKHYQLARQRQLDPEEASAELRPYLPMLLGQRKGRAFVLAAVVVGAAVALFVSVGIFALRSSIEGPAAGFAFGLLALGIATASYINAHSHADPVADAIEDARRAYAKEQRAHRRLASSVRILLAERALRRVRHIQQEHALRGQAASAYVHALKLEAMAQSPETVGHGVGHDSSALTVRGRNGAGVGVASASQQASKGKRL